MANPQRPAGPQKWMDRHGLRILIILGIVILGCITLRSALSLSLYVITSITSGTGLTGDFWSNEFPVIVLLAITALGAFAIYRLARILRK